MSMTWEQTNETKWPDLSKDRKATEMAREQLGPNAEIHALLALAQQIKGAL
jgi:hypothetical protein